MAVAPVTQFGLALEQDPLVGRAWPTRKVLSRLAPAPSTPARRASVNGRWSATRAISAGRLVQCPGVEAQISSAGGRASLAGPAARMSVTDLYPRSPPSAGGSSGGQSSGAGTAGMERYRAVKPSDRSSPVAPSAVNIAPSDVDARTRTCEVRRPCTSSSTTTSIRVPCGADAANCVVAQTMRRAVDVSIAVMATPSIAPP